MKISSGDKVLDMLLGGGYETDVINTLYGPAGSGKTLLCMMAIKGVVDSGKKVVYIDTEGGFSIERFKQLYDNHEELLDNILFLQPVNFEEQKKSFEKLKELINNNIGLVIVDTLSMLYRLEIGKGREAYEVNKELGEQLGFLREITKKGFPVIITNQVYADFENKDGVKIVGGDLLRYGSKCMIELQNARAGHRRAILRKHRSMPEKSIDFKIVEKGIEEKEKKKFIPL